MIPAAIHLARATDRAARRLWRAESIFIHFRFCVFTLRGVPVMAFAWVQFSIKDGPL